MIDKLEELIGNNDVVREVYKPIQKETIYGSLQILAPDIVHQIDILYLPKDEKGFKYLLLVVDMHTKLIEGRALMNRNFEQTVMHALEDIYEKSTTFNIPRCLYGDDEFNNRYIKDWCNVHSINLKIAVVDRHRQLSLINTACKTIGTVIFKYQLGVELDTKKPYKNWHTVYRKIIDILNEHTKKNTKLATPASDKDKINILHNRDKNILKIGDHVRLSQVHPVDFTTGQKLIGKLRSTDPKWSKQIYVITDYYLPNNSVPLYRIKTVDTNKIIDTYFTKEQLMLTQK